MTSRANASSVIISSESFLAAYLEFLSKISSQQTDLLWWASDVASKNRFQTRLPELLQALLEGKDADACQSGCGWFHRAVQALLNIRHSYLRARLAHRILGNVPLQRVRSGAQYVVRSVIYDSSFPSPGTYRDAFFGDLISYLNGQESLLVLADVQGDYRKALEGIKACDEVNIVPWEYFLTLGDILQSALRSVFWRPRALPRLEFMGKDVTRSVGRYLSDPGAMIQPRQLFHYPAILRLCQKIEVKTFLMTYEANPWEKMCILALRKAAPKARVYGFQHNVVPQASANMFIAPGEDKLAPLPDKLFTVGEEPHRILQKYGAYPPGFLQTACALRMAHLFREPFPRRKGRRVLIAMEGVDGVKDLVRAVWQELKDDASFEVVFRTHPVLPWAYFEERYGFRLTDYPHFSESKTRSLVDDIAESDVVVYWGTTVSMEALSLGRPVVHFDNGSLLSFDPLFACSHLKWRVKAGERFKPVLEGILSLSDDEYRHRHQAAKAYLQSYFYPVTTEALALFRG